MEKPAIVMCYGDWGQSQFVVITRSIRNHHPSSYRAEKRRWSRNVSNDCVLSLSLCSSYNHNPATHTSRHTYSPIRIYLLQCLMALRIYTLLIICLRLFLAPSTDDVGINERYGVVLRNFHKANGSCLNIPSVTTSHAIDVGIEQRNTAIHTHTHTNRNLANGMSLINARTHQQIKYT